jgi:hypothetical protein
VPCSSTEAFTLPIRGRVAFGRRGKKQDAMEPKNCLYDLDHRFRATVPRGSGTRASPPRYPAPNAMEVWMKKLIIIATAVLLGTSAFAAENKAGASKMSPGHETQNSTSGTTKGASENSPGDRMQDKGTVGMSRGSTKGASEYSPGDRMNDKRKKY